MLLDALAGLLDATAGELLVASAGLLGATAGLRGGPGALDAMKGLLCASSGLLGGPELLGATSGLRGPEVILGVVNEAAGVTDDTAVPIECMGSDPSAGTREAPWDLFTASCWVAVFSAIFADPTGDPPAGIQNEDWVGAGSRYIMDGDTSMFESSPLFEAIGESSLH